jgi:hypothetical protein
MSQNCLNNRKLSSKLNSSPPNPRRITAVVVHAVDTVATKVATGEINARTEVAEAEEVVEAASRASLR